MLEALLLSGPALGRISARYRVVRLGGPKVRDARSNSADVHEAGDVFMSRDSSIFEVVSLAQSVELTVQFILLLWMTCSRFGMAALVCFVVSLETFTARSLISFVGWWFIVGMRAFVGGGICCERTLSLTLVRGCGLTWFPLLHFFSVSLWWFWGSC